MRRVNIVQGLCGISLHIHAYVMVTALLPDFSTPLIIQFASCFASLQIVHNQRWVKAQNEASILPTIPVDIRISHTKGVQYRCTLYCSSPMGTHLNHVAIMWPSCHYWLLGMLTVVFSQSQLQMPLISTFTRPNPGTRRLTLMDEGGRQCNWASITVADQERGAMAVKSDYLEGDRGKSSAIFSLENAGTPL